MGWKKAFFLNSLIPKAFAPDSILGEGQDGERNANLQELSEASDQAIQKHDLALKDSISGIVQ